MNRLRLPILTGGGSFGKEASTGYLMLVSTSSQKGGWRSGENLIVLTDAVGVIPCGN